MGEVRGSAVRATAAERRAKVVDLRRQRLSFEQIAVELRVTRQRAWQLYNEALAAVPAQQVDAHRAEELALIDDAVADLLVIARNHKQPHTAVEAWNAIRLWAERKARLLGLDAPERHEHLTIDVIDAELRVLRAELGELPPPGVPVVAVAAIESGPAGREERAEGDEA